MNITQIRRASVVAAAAAIAVSAAGQAAYARVPSAWKNCDAVNAKYAHGVGRAGAHDSTKSGDPVTNFVHNTKLYNQAMSYNKGLDRDKDGIACEKL